MGSTSYLKVSGVFQNLARISDVVGEISTGMGFGPKAVYALQMAVDEACTNIIEHAYGGEGRGDIELTFESLPDALRITIRDWGQAFDPGAVPEPNLDAPLHERATRGLGLFLMQKLMDEVTFQFDPNNGNKVVLTKRLETKA